MGRLRISILRWIIVGFCVTAVVGIGVELPSVVSAHPHGARTTVSSAASVGTVAGSNRQRPASGLQPYISHDWAQYGFSPLHTGYNPYERTIGVSNVSRLTVAWSDTTLLPNSAAFAVVNGVAYTETDDGTFYALNAATGALLWTAAIGNTISDPAVANGVVYVTAADGFLYAFNAAGCGSATCTWQWRVSLQNFSPANPTVVNGVIYVTSNGEGNISAYNATNGAPLWSTPLSAGGDSSSAAPTVANGVVYVGASAVYAFDASTGSLLWTGKVNNSSDFFTGSVAVQNGVAYANANTGHVYAYAAAGCGSVTCSASWTGATAASQVAAAPAVANGVVYVAAAGAFFAFNAAGCGSATCSASWTSPMNNPPAEYAPGSPSVANGVVYFGTSYGTIYAVAAAGCGKSQCSALWTYVTGGIVVGTPVVINGMMYVGVSNFSANTDEKFYGFSVPSAPPGML